MNSAYFGEIALLQDNCTRTATVRALGFCDLFVLTREELEEALERFSWSCSTLKLIWSAQLL